MKKLILATLIFILLNDYKTFASTEPIEFSEISFKDSHSDWIELKITSPLKDTITIKDDGKITEIHPEQISNENYILIHFKSEEEKIESINNILHIYTKKSGITGTTEQITIESDSKILDAVCWQNSSPPSSEQKDIEALIAANSWEGDCINSDEIKRFESIVKISQNQNKESWKILLHPTPGEENTTKNSPPIAKITIQKPDGMNNADQISLETPFSLNLDGSESYDPDGDEISYKWKFPDETIDKKNPKSYRFDVSGNYEISLTVTDTFGSSDTKTIQINALNKKEDIKNKDLLDEVINNETLQNKDNESSNWFNYFLIISMAGGGLFISLYK